MEHANSPFLNLLRRWSLFASFFFIGTLNGLSQVILPAQFIDERYPLFNDDSIARQNIERITIRIMRKPSSKPIYDDGRRIIYHFNELGRLVSFQKLYPTRLGQIDTSSNTFIYRNDIIQARSEKIGKYRKRVSIDHINTHHTIETIKVKRGAMDWDELGKEEIHRSETADEERIIETTLRGGINEKAYESRINIYDLDKRLLKKEVYHGVRIISTESLEYMDGKVSRYVSSNFSKGSTLEVGYTTLSFPQDEGTWCENSTCQTWSIVYHDNGLPKAFILMTPESQDMEIWEYRYSYREAIQSQ